MTAEEIKVRRLSGQQLLSPGGPLDVAGALCGLQAQFFSNALHALAIRCGGNADTAGLVKNWTVRGTLHLFPERDLPLFLHRGRSRFLRPQDTMNGDERISGSRKQKFAALILDSVAQGVEEREALKEVCRRAGMSQGEEESLFDPWGGLIRALCEAGLLCHQAQQRKAFRRCPPFVPMEQREAELELARRYFAHYGPATGKDAAYFFGTTQKQVGSWLSELSLQSARWNGRTYFYFDRACAGDSIPDCLFLAGFDPLMLGYEKTESLFLPPKYLRNIFTRSGIVRPALLLEGQVAGRWQRRGRTVTATLFRPLPDHLRWAVEEEAARLWPGVRCVLEEGV